ncbi:diguanylate cyclase [Paraeggerthella hongkongensis]|uniref:Diguanylate cyclase n=2 Tax=Paraeggerthella hongkongensis TaxID=230658 RepID=A0A3N0BKZ6_9ACTN|nr:diguanylate cyclase [Paraeggerthella hongkongensis]
MLIVDDSRIDRTLLANMFAESYSILEAASGQEALVTMAERKVDVVVLDIDMKGMNGFALIDAMKADPSLSDIPIIVETGESAHEESALLRGADDFIAKPFNTTIARRRVDNIVTKHVLEREKLQTALRKTELLAAHRAQELLYAAEHDSLTGLYNRTAFCRKTAELLKSRPHEEFAIVQFDIERFKIFNELHGSIRGDEVLKAIAQCLDKTLRNRGVYGRMEADHFALCLPKDMALSNNLATQLELALANAEAEHEIVLYFGMYEITDRTMPVDIMCDRATLALRSIKGNYNTRFALYDSNMHQSLITKHTMKAEGERALEHREFEPFIQPIFNLASGALVGGEALVRWRHPDKGLIPPGQFLPFFENSGFIVRLDSHIREEVCRFLASMESSGIASVPLSVNISRLEFYDPHLCNNLVDLVKRHRLPLSRLRLEITESAYADNLPQLLQAMEKLQRFGFTVLMDDFGTGYSSLSMLRDVPIDMIKLDMRFLGGESRNRAREENILRAIVPMAKSLDLPVIAEGVETADQASLLESVGCDLVQGYLYAKPVSRDEFLALAVRETAKSPLKKQKA